ncbi:hypothetical protein BaOVIS_011420 [Babesia ovis]|uniref:Succinate dehydrogenase assembly factor 4, mitochondrial n=1 Tax=Babesia ovis TaxID=5869 RepID=A0A9W5T9I9_BABOV|nr:hypothetical protein BaOVIS_011420 [Babesia ovis]
MFVKQVCSNPCFVRGLNRMSATATKKGSTTARNLYVMACETNSRRHVAASAMFAGITDPMLGARFMAVEAERMRHCTTFTEPVTATPMNGGDGSASGALTCSGEEDDSEGTERSRVANSGPSGKQSASDPLGDQNKDNANIEPRPKEPLVNGANEHGYFYDKHEPTMFGDWSHMGRVTDF